MEFSIEEVAEVQVIDGVHQLLWAGQLVGGKRDSNMSAMEAELYAEVQQLDALMSDSCS